MSSDRFDIGDDAEPASRGIVAIRVLWPAFITAIAAEAIFFTIFDPFELHFFGAPLDWSRQAIYTLGFFGFWALGCASSAITVWLERSAAAAGGRRRSDGAR